MCRAVLHGAEKSSPEFLRRAPLESDETLRPFLHCTVPVPVAVDVSDGFTRALTNVGGNLTISSVQDTSTYQGQQSSSGGSISVGLTAPSIGGGNHCSSEQCVNNAKFLTGLGAGLANLTPAGMVAGTGVVAYQLTTSIINNGSAQTATEVVRGLTGLPADLMAGLNSADPQVRGEAIGQRVGR